MKPCHKPWLAFVAMAAWCACNDTTEDADIPYGFACNPELTISDLDNDGFKYPTDCDDNDPTVFPGAQELCNLVDDNCNGNIDEYTSRTEMYLVHGQRGDDPVYYPYTSGGQARDPEDFPGGLASGDEAGGMLMADVDGDRIQDVVIQASGEGWVAAYTLDCDGGFIRTELFEVEGDERLRGVGDIEGDGDADLVLFSLSGWKGVVWSNDGSGNFTKRSGHVDWQQLSSMTADGRLAGSQVMQDVDGDGFADWVMCYAQYDNTYCYAAKGDSDGLFSATEHLLTLTDVEASSITLGDFDCDGLIDAATGLRETSGPGSDIPEAFVYVLSGLEGGGIDDDPQLLFDFAWQASGASLGYAPDWIGNGWFRTVNLDQTDDSHDEVMIYAEVWYEGEAGMAVVFVPDLFDVDLESGFQDGEIRPVIRELIPLTSSMEADVFSVVGMGMLLE